MASVLPLPGVERKVCFLSQRPTLLLRRLEARDWYGLVEWNVKEPMEAALLRLFDVDAFFLLSHEPLLRLRPGECKWKMLARKSTPMIRLNAMSDEATSTRLMCIRVRQGTESPKVAGDLIKWPTDETNRVPAWTIICPGCGRGSSLADHNVEEHADGTVSIMPSCVCPRENCKAHYYVNHNKIDWL